MGWIDDLAPRWALRRALAQQALKQLRAYDAARTPRKWNSWQRPKSGPRTEAQLGADTLRASVRDLLRNNGYAQRAHRTLVRATVGTGILGSPMAGDRPAPQRARDAWARWADDCDFDGHLDLYGLQALTARTVFESGEALLRFYRQPFDAGEAVAPVRLQLLEPDFIDTGKLSLGRASEGGNWIDRGIEYDSRGRKVALWLHQVHPGDQSRYLLSKYESVRVPIGEVVQVYDMLRPGQDRGISIFAAAVAPLKDLGDYFEAEIMRKRIEACLSVFVTAPEGEGPLVGRANGTDGESGAELRQLAPGMITRLNPGESVSHVAPSGSPEIKQFADQILLLAAAAGGVMFEHMTGNFEKVNYSSYRVGSHDFAGWAEQQQWHLFVQRMCRPVAQQFNQAALAAGLISRETTLRWTPPSPVTSPDPKKDADADQLNLRLGALAPSELAERHGWTYAELLDRIAADLAAADAKGIAFDGDPRKNLKGQADGRSDDAGAAGA